MRFEDLPDAVRMHWRDLIERAGADVQGYYGDGVIVALPQNVLEFRDKFRAFFDFQGDNFFPLGSDVNGLDARFRHDGPAGKYPAGNGGFWRFVVMVPKLEVFA